VVQPWGEPGNYWQATVVRVCPTAAQTFEYLDYVELTLARHGLPLDTLSDLVVVDAIEPAMAITSVLTAKNLK
jgi:hypothetical protein